MGGAELVERGERMGLFIYDDRNHARNFTPRLVKILCDLVANIDDEPERLLVPGGTTISSDGGDVGIVGEVFMGVKVEAISPEAEPLFSAQGQGSKEKMDKFHLVAMVTRLGNVILGGF